jgi:hypothetical protein
MGCKNLSRLLRRPAFMVKKPCIVMGSPSTLTVSSALLLRNSVLRLSGWVEWLIISIAGSMYSSTPVTDRRYATDISDIGRTSIFANITFAEVEICYVSLTTKPLLMYKHLKTQSCEPGRMGHRPHCTVATYVITFLCRTSDPIFLQHVKGT